MSIGLVMLFMINVELFAEVDLQKGMYDAAEEMMRYNEKMNRAIAEHNKVDENDDVEMRLHSMVNDFEETENGYLLEETIEDSDNKKVEVNIEDGVLIITTTTLEKDLLLSELNISEITTMESFTISLFIPNDADENKMQKEYRDGFLRVTFPKK